MKTCHWPTRVEWERVPRSRGRGKWGDVAAWIFPDEVRVGAGEEERKWELGESWVFFKGGLVLSGKEFYGKNWEMSHLPDRWSITGQIVFFWGSRHYPRGFPGFAWHQWVPLKTLLWNWIPFQHIWLSQLLPVSESYMHEDALSVELFTFRLFRFGVLAYPKTRLSHYSLLYSLFKNKLTTQR